MTQHANRARRPARSIAVFLLLAAAIYAALLAAWPMAGGVYARGFRATGNYLFGSMGGASVRYRAAAQTIVYADTDVVVRNLRTGDEAARPMSTRYRGYYPAAMLVALAVATPLPWRRRLRALAWGLVVLQALIAWRELMILLEVLSGDNPVATIALSPFWRGALESVSRPLGASTASTFVLPVLVWIAVTFRGRDWARLFGDSDARPRERVTGGHSHGP